MRSQPADRDVQHLDRSLPGISAGWDDRLVTFDPSRPFTRAQALGAGVSRHRLEGPSYRRLHPLVYVARDSVLAPDDAIRALLLSFPSNAWASHATAARLRGFVIPTIGEEHVTVPSPNSRRYRPGVVVHIDSRRQDVGVVRGIRASLPTDVLVELGELLTLVDLVVLTDDMLHKRAVAIAELTDASASRNVREAVTLASDRAESPMETRLRLLLHFAGLPTPQVNAEVKVCGRVRRLDLSWPQCRVAVEYDGRQHASSSSQFESDVYRRSELDRAGWQVVTVIARGIYTDPGETVARVHSALLERGCAGVPRTPEPGWTRHFPRRPATAYSAS